MLSNFLSVGHFRENGKLSILNMHSYCILLWSPFLWSFKNVYRSSSDHFRNMHEDKIICLYFGISPVSWEALKERLHRYLMEGNPNTVYILTFGSNVKSRVLLVLSSKLRVLLRVKGIHSIFRLIMFGIITKADRLHCSYSLPEEYSQIKPGKDLDYNTGVVEPAIVTTVSLFLPWYCVITDLIFLNNFRLLWL